MCAKGGTLLFSIANIMKLMCCFDCVCVCVHRLVCRRFHRLFHGSKALQTMRQIVLPVAFGVNRRRFCNGFEQRTCDVTLTGPGYKDHPLTDGYRVRFHEEGGSFLFKGYTSRTPLLHLPQYKTFCYAHVHGRVLYIQENDDTPYTGYTLDGKMVRVIPDPEDVPVGTTVTKYAVSRSAILVSCATDSEVLGILKYRYATDKPTHVFVNSHKGYGTMVSMDGSGQSDIVRFKFSSGVVGFYDVRWDDIDKPTVKLNGGIALVYAHTNMIVDDAFVFLEDSVMILDDHAARVTIEYDRTYPWPFKINVLLHVRSFRIGKEWSVCTLSGFAQTTQIKTTTDGYRLYVQVTSGVNTFLYVYRFQRRDELYAYGITSSGDPEPVRVRWEDCTTPYCIFETCLALGNLEHATAGITAESPLSAWIKLGEKTLRKLF